MCSCVATLEAMFNRILFCRNGHQGTVLRFVEVLTKPPRVQCNRTNKNVDIQYTQRVSGITFIRVLAVIFLVWNESTTNLHKRSTV
jgi:hypothetical protein